jgi:pentatricopeptide repeat protein
VWRFAECKAGIPVLISQYSLQFDQLHIFEEYKLAVQHVATAVWTVIIQAYSIHGQGQEVLQLFNSMQQHKVKPDATTLTCVLTGCSHSGLVEQAWNIYNTMEAQFNITPDEHHQTCMVDVWGRAGMLEQAENFINRIPHQHVTMWKALLGACHNHRDIKCAQNAAAQILKLDPNDASTYVSLANTHATVGNWRESKHLWTEMKQQNIKKIPGITWVTINGITEVFYVDSWDHPYPISKYMC